MPWTLWLLTLEYISTYAHTHIYKKSVLKTILFLESVILCAFSHVSWQYNTNAAWPIYSTHAPNLFLLGSLSKTSQSSQTESASCQQKKKKKDYIKNHFHFSVAI